jgi:hypothetical protein
LKLPGDGWNGIESFDHLVGEREQLVWEIEAERLRCGEINDEIELGRLLDRDVRRLRPAQDFVRILGGAPDRGSAPTCRASNRGVGVLKASSRSARIPPTVPATRPTG